MKIYKAAIIGLGASGLAVNKLIYGNRKNEIIAFEGSDIEKRNNFFGFWLTEWMLPFQKLIDKKWYSWSISNHDNQVTHSDLDHPYCVINFQTWKKFCLDTNNKLQIEKKKVKDYFKLGNFFKIITEDNSEYFAEKIFDSRTNNQTQDKLFQHFFGVNIVTKEKIFDVKKLTLMHFTNEKNPLHFIYVLPFKDNMALVESTVFSQSILSEEWYRNQILQYLSELKIINFEEKSYEKGIIPMFFTKEKKYKDSNVYNIGIRGGACKPSTGYAFSFLIRQIQLFKQTNKNSINVHSFIENKMDQVFLNYLKNSNEDGSSFFNMAKNLNGYEFQSFMMGYSSFLTKLKIIKSMPKIPFIKALFK